MSDKNTHQSSASLREAAQNALTTLDGIANANPRDTADFETPAEWIVWAKSRASWAADALREPIAQEVYAERILKQMLHEDSNEQTEKKCGTCGFIGQEDPVKGCPKCGFDDMRAMRQTTLLTRQEMLAAILPLTDSNAAAEIILDISADEYRAIEAAIIAKLQATQEPVQAGELPEPDTHCFDDDTGQDVWSYSRPLVEQIVRAALSARKPLTDEREDDPAPPEGKRWFYCTTPTNDVAGWQRWRVAATSLEEAKRIFNEEGGEFDSEELEVQNFEEPEWDDPEDGIVLEVNHADQA